MKQYIDTLRKQNDRKAPCKPAYLQLDAGATDATKDRHNAAESKTGYGEHDAALIVAAGEHAQLPGVPVLRTTLHSHKR